jgi:hypothetical protein
LTVIYLLILKVIYRPVKEHLNFFIFYWAYVEIGFWSKIWTVFWRNFLFFLLLTHKLSNICSWILIFILYLISRTIASEQSPSTSKVHICAKGLIVSILTYICSLNSDDISNSLNFWQSRIKFWKEGHTGASIA